MLSSTKTSEQKHAARLRRLALWDRPIASTGHRLRAWVNMLFVDHAIVRLFYLNKHKIGEGFWRSAQPTPGQIAQFAKDGIRTIINLRGGREFGSWPLEREACEQHGITLLEVTARSREAPTADVVREFSKVFETAQAPILVHCKAGADRAGLVAALYLLLKEGRSVDEALEQLSPRFGHWRWSKTGILDQFLIQYRDEGEAKGLSLLDWVENHYDPAELNAKFKPHAFSNFVVDTVLRRE